MKKSLTKEHRIKISEALKGRSAWNKGKKTPDEIKVKISLSLIGQKHSEKTKKKMSEKHKGKKFSEETIRKIRESNIGQKRTKEFRDKISGKNSPHWKGGIRYHNGYIQIMSPKHPFRNKKNYILEHRLVIEKQIGRFLKPEESSHHINKIKNDNRPENLMAFSTDSAHRRFEKGGFINSNEIIFDGRLYH